MVLKLSVSLESGSKREYEKDKSKKKEQMIMKILQLKDLKITRNLQNKY